MSPVELYSAVPKADPPLHPRLLSIPDSAVADKDGVHLVNLKTGETINPV